MALHDFVVKVTVFMKAVDSSVILSEDVALIFTQYANALAEQGLLVTAAKYCRGSSLESKVLRDRLYRSRESPGCLAALGSAPEFPFSLVQVKKAPAGATAAQTRQQPQSYTNQHQRSQHAASQSHSAYGTQQQAQSVSISTAITMSFELPAVPFSLSSFPSVGVISSTACRMGRVTGSDKWKNILCKPNYWSIVVGGPPTSVCCSSTVTECSKTRTRSNEWFCSTTNYCHATSNSSSPTASSATSS